MFQWGSIQKIDQKNGNRHTGRAFLLHLQLKKECKMKKSMSIPFLALATVFLAACNTVEGVGEDVQAGGEAIEDTARATQEEISE